MKLTVVLNLSNKYKNRLLSLGKEVCNGNGGLEEVRLVSKGKRAAVELLLTDFDIVIEDDDCPELWRYDSIEKAFGDKDMIARLKPVPVCDLIKISPRACDGCVKNPRAQKSAGAGESVLQRVAQAK